MLEGKLNLSDLLHSSQMAEREKNPSSVLNQDLSDGLISFASELKEGVKALDLSEREAPITIRSQSSPDNNYQSIEKKVLNSIIPKEKFLPEVSKKEAPQTILGPVAGNLKIDEIEGSDAKSLLPQAESKKLATHLAHHRPASYMSSEVGFQNNELELENVIPREHSKVSRLHSEKKFLLAKYAQDDVGAIKADPTNTDQLTAKNDTLIQSKNEFYTAVKRPVSREIEIPEKNMEEVLKKINTPNRNNNEQVRLSSLLTAELPSKEHEKIRARSTGAFLQEENQLSSRPLPNHSNDQSDLLKSVLKTTAVSAPLVGQMESGHQVDVQSIRPQVVANLSSTSTHNQMEIINRVAQLIEVNNLNSKESMDVLVKHNELGDFKLSVHRQVGSPQISLEVLVQDESSHRLFSQNESELLKALDQKGIKLSDFKITQGQAREFSLLNPELARESSRALQQDSGSQQDRSSETSQQRQSREGQQQSDSERRRELWREFQKFQEAA